MKTWTARARQQIPDLRISNIYRVQANRSDHGWLSELWSVTGMKAEFDQEELVRRLFTWGADLNLEATPLLWGERVLLNPQMPLPHPDLHRQSVLLQCAAEIDSNALHPILGQSLADRLSEEVKPAALDFYAQGRQVIPSF